MNSQSKWYEVDWLTLKGVKRVKVLALVDEGVFVEEVWGDPRVHLYLDDFSIAERFSLYDAVRCASLPPSP